jgi:uncharacterized membrane protein
MLTTAVVLWVHIFGAIGWLGGAMTFGMAVAPNLVGMSPQARLEFFVKVAPKFTRFVEAFSLLTVIFGVITATVVVNGNFSLWTLSNNFQILITIGALIALVTVILALTVIVPVSHKIARISQDLLKTPGPPPAELPAALKTLKVSSTIAIVLLVVVTIFMVAGVNL